MVHSINRKQQRQQSTRQGNGGMERHGGMDPWSGLEASVQRQFAELVFSTNWLSWFSAPIGGWRAPIQPIRLEGREGARNGNNHGGMERHGHRHRKRLMVTILGNNGMEAATAHHHGQRPDGQTTATISGNGSNNQPNKGVKQQQSTRAALNAMVNGNGNGNGTGKGPWSTMVSNHFRP